MYELYDTSTTKGISFPYLVYNSHLNRCCGFNASETIVEDRLVYPHFNPIKYPEAKLLTSVKTFDEIFIEYPELQI